jgi:hypothetical protein
MISGTGMSCQKNPNPITKCYQMDGQPNDVRSMDNQTLPDRWITNVISSKDPSCELCDNNLELTSNLKFNYDQNSNAHK